jgi:hypothetical protein
LRTALLLTSHNLDEWSANAAATPLPGGALPYGLQNLSGSYRLIWSNAHHKRLWCTKLVRMAGGLARRRTPGLQGSLLSCCSTSRLANADVALSVFEDAGLGFARWQSLSRSSTPHVMLACWLAEDSRHMTSGQLASIRRSMRSISRIVVFSANQAPILEGLLGVQPDRISVVPFGVDTQYYSPSAVATKVDRRGGGGGVVAVGGDSRRDYATLIAAARIADVPLTLVCYPRNVAGLDLPSQVRLHGTVGHEEYRRLLLTADLVVTPTVAPAYPSGQSVVLEAMSMGRATLSTDSPAMREYVSDGVDGVLVPPRAPGHMAELISSLLADDDRRQLLGETAAKTARAFFDLEHMWQKVAALLDGAIAG